MNALCVGFGIMLMVLVALPLSLLAQDLWRPAAWHWTSGDAPELVHLALNTTALSFCAAAFALPIGIALAVLLLRTAFVGQTLLWFTLAVALFVPVPILVVIWRAIFGEGTSMCTGLAPAIAMHALAAIPWVTFIVGVGVTWIDSESEDEAGLVVAPWRVILFVTLPRARASILAAAVFVLIQTATEVSIAEMALVPTFAETTRALFAASDRDGLARTLALSIPVWVCATVVLAGMVAYLTDRLPPLTATTRPLRDLEIGTPGSRLSTAALLLAIMVASLASLIWKLGIAGHPPQWSDSTAGHFIQSEMRLLGGELFASLATSFAAGSLTAMIALVGCWLARDSVQLRWLLLLLLTAVWILPGPVVGIGLHRLILLLPPGPWKQVLHHGPSPALLIWVQTIRALPIAAVCLWPVVRLIPNQTFDEAKLAGASALSQFVHIVLPTTWRATVVTAFASTALCLGEVGASTRVETPGWESFAKTFLNRIHYGVDNSLAAASLILIASLVAIGVIVFTLSRCVRSA